jgi:multiple sugar transport system substrate-binding protein
MIELPGRAARRRRREMAGRGLAAGALWLALQGGALGAGQSAPAPAAPAGRVDVWLHQANSSAEFKVIKQAAEAFNGRQRLYKVDISSVSTSRNYAEHVHRAAANGTLPCLLEFDGPFLYEFAWLGYLQPIDVFMPPALLRDVLPSVIAQGTYDGRLYSLAQFDSGLGLWGNRRYLAAAGVRVPTLGQPWRLDEFERALDKLSAVDGVAYPLDLTYYSTLSEFFSYAYAPILQGFGGDLIERATYRSAKGVLDGPESVAAMQHFQRWFVRGWARAVFDRSDDFAKGRAALSWNGHWNYRRFLAALGKDLVLLPLPDFGHGIKTGIGSWSWGVSTTCRERAGAGAFLAFLMSTGEILRMTNANGAVPARQAALARSPLYGANGPLRLYARQINAGLGVTRPVTPAYGTISLTFAQTVAAIVAGGDAQTELSKAAAIIDRDIAAHRNYPSQ